MIRWEFLDYRPVPGFGPVAHRYRILVGDDPHASSMLIVRFPDDGVMFTGDLFYPGPLESFPSLRSSAALYSRVRNVRDFEIILFLLAPRARFLGA